MKEKEFRRLKRLELVEVIYQLEKELEDVRMENAGLRSKLEEKDEALNAKRAELKNVMALEDAVARLNQVCELAEDMQKEYKKKKLYLKNKKSESNPV